jgi:REP element-mobilizing transposase RayT
MQVMGQKEGQVDKQNEVNNRMAAFLYYVFVRCCIYFAESMRFPRVKAEGQSFYHCVSRVVDGRFIFQTSGHGSVEAERFLQLMRRLEAFSGIVILNYALMANHFHLLCEVPEPRTLSEAELLQRVEAGFGPARREALEQQVARWRQQPDGLDQIQRLLEPYRRRMNDISIFIKELKGSFAQWFNRRHRRYGALWAERFKSVLLEGGEALAALSAYIDLNPVRAGLCADPKDYRYCGYAEALATDSSVARQGIRTILDQPETISWNEVSRQYRKHLFLKGSANSKRPAFDLATAQHVVEQQNGELSLQERLRCRIRYFTDGVILGSQCFVESHFDRLKQKLGYRRRQGATSKLQIPSWRQIGGKRN